MAKLKVLVVEDSKVILNIIVKTISDRYDIKVANNGIDGLKVYNLFHPDIVVTDINMPKLNGIDMLKQMRALNKNFKAIVLTSYDSIDYLMDATELNLTKYLMKPIDKDILMNALGKASQQLQDFTTVSNKIITLSENYIWNYDNLELYKSNILVKLTPKEKKILNYLLDASKSIKTYDEILYEVWEDFENSNKKILKTMMTNLRKKLPSNLIENVYGIGYKVILIN